MTNSLISDFGVICMGKRKNLRGSALLWAVCTLLIFMVILTGILSLNKRYLNEEIIGFSKKQAEYYARSAVDVAAKGISDGTIPDTAKTVELKLDDSVTCKVSIERTLGDIELKSSTEYAQSEYSVVGLMKKSQSGGWEFTGYTVY